MKNRILFWLRFSAELVALPAIFLAALFSRFASRDFDIGLGPEPLINNVYHKDALRCYGYKAETFVASIYVITNEFDHKFISINKFSRFLNPFRIFVFVLFRYRALYIYFNGGPLMSTVLLWRIEPLLFQLAGIKVLVMPYGSDVMAMDRCPNYLLRHAVSKDYPSTRINQIIVKKKIDLWLRHSDHVVAGCDWVDYLYHWDTLMLAHFSIDTELWSDPLFGKNSSSLDLDRPLRVLHAPNHRESKGTRYFLRAIDELNKEGHKVELVLIERVPNLKIREIMKTIDIVADQLIVGWYAMFALEGMALGKPVLCYLREDLKRLYVDSELVGENEIPIINCGPSTVKSALRELIINRNRLLEIGIRSRNFVEKHHSLKSIGSKFDFINRKIGVNPSFSANSSCN